MAVLKQLLERDAATKFVKESTYAAQAMILIRVNCGRFLKFGPSSKDSISSSLTGAIFSPEMVRLVVVNLLFVSPCPESG